MKWIRNRKTAMFKIEYNSALAQQYADDMLDKVGEVIGRVLQSGFVINKQLASGPNVKVVVSQHGFTRQFLNDFSKATQLKDLLQGDIAYLQQVVERVRNENIDNLVKLGKRKWSRYYQGQLQFEDFHTIMHYIFVECGYDASNFIDKGKIVDDIGLKVCPYCGQNYIGKVLYPRNNGQMHVARAQIDHFYPKGQYPFLALSYANFVPCCASCNMSHKHIENVLDDHGRLRIMPPYSFDESKFRFGFGIKHAGWIDDDNIEVKTLFDVKTASDQALKDGYEQILGVDKLYEYHNDVVQDVIIRKAIDLTAQKVFYENGVRIDKAYLDRYVTAIYGYEQDPKNDKNRIMSKFLRDIVRQVDLMARKALGNEGKLIHNQAGI